MLEHNSISVSPKPVDEWASEYFKITLEVYIRVF